MSIPVYPGICETTAADYTFSHDPNSLAVCAGHNHSIAIKVSSLVFVAELLTIIDSKFHMAQPSASVHETSVRIRTHKCVRHQQFEGFSIVIHFRLIPGAFQSQDRPGLLTVNLYILRSH